MSQYIKRFGRLAGADIVPSVTSVTRVTGKYTMESLSILSGLKVNYVNALVHFRGPKLHMGSQGQLAMRPLVSSTALRYQPTYRI